MTLDEMRMEMFIALEKYEDTMRRYCDKVDKDRPWVSSALWQACWSFRKALSVDIEYLRTSLQEAKRLRDPD